MFVAVVAVYALLARGAAAGRMAWLGFAVGQVYLLADWL